MQLRAGSVWKRLSTLLFAAPWMALHLSALEPDKTIDQYIMREWTLTSGLPQMSVTSIVQTNDHYLWIGTFGGLARFDGNRFTRFRIRDGLPSLRILSLLVDRRGTLWVGTEDAGVASLQPGATRFIRLPDGPGSPIWALAEDDDGILWIGTSRGLFSFDGRRVRPLEQEGLERLNVTSLRLDQTGRLWVGARGLLLVRRDERFHPVVLDPTLPKDVRSWIFAMDVRGDDIWAYTGSGLWRVSVEESEAVGRFRASESLTAAVHVDSHDNVWFTGQSLRRLAGDELTTAGGELSGLQVRSLFEDREGTLWIGTDGHGLFQLSDGPITTWSTPQGLVGRSVLPITEGPDGAIWVGTRCGGLNRFDGKSFQEIDYEPGGTQDCVFSLLTRRDGTLWIGDEKGLATFSSGSLKRFGSEDGLPPYSTPRALHEDREGTLWAGFSDGLYRLEGDHFRRFGREDGLEDARVVFITEDPEGAIWIGAEGGLTRWKNGVFRGYGPASGVPAGAVRAVLPDGDGLWIGTYGGGIAFMEKGEVIHLPEHELPDEAISSLLVDGRGYLWMCGNRGLFGVPRDDLLASFKEKREEAGWFSFGISDGMKTPECNGGGQPSAWKARDGKLWFATIDGVAVVDPKEPLTPRQNPVVVVESVFSSGKELATREEIVIGPERDLEVVYTGISFSAPERVRFRYRLHGFDDDWVDAGSRRAAYYTNLPGGDYRFEVMARFDSGEWSSTSELLGVTVRPRFRETRWFALLMIAAVCLFFLAIHRLRVRHLKRRQAELAGMVEERTRELVESHRKLELLNQRKNELLGIAAHDLRNPLGAILSYSEILEHEMQDAAGRLPRFARNIRSLAGQTLDLVNQLLDVSAIEAGLVRVRPAPLPLPEFVEETVSLYRTLAMQKQIEIELREIDPVTVSADRDRVGEILSNLLSNAVKFTPKGGRVTVWSERLSRDVGLYVGDSGPGLEPSELDRVFRGGRLSAQPTGGEPSTGFGLVIVRKLVELHGGRVEVRSKAGGGAVFGFTLPLRS